MKWKKQWKCTSKCINGKKLLKWHRSLSTVKCNNSKATTILGFWNLDKSKRQLKSRRKKVTIPQLSNSILKEAFLLELLMLYIILMSATPKMFLKRLQVIWLLQVCSKKLDKCTSKCKNSKELLIAM